jgi:hypothetical protein
MILGIIAGTLSILTTWTVLLSISSGIGLASRRAFGVRAINSNSLLSSFWLGLSLTVLFLQVWHLLFPILWLTLAVVIAFGVAGLLWCATELWEWLDRTSWRKRCTLIATLVLVGLWVANQAMGPCSEYDSGMYHIPAINWAKSFPIIPGLGNLHGRLAFNNSHLLYAAMLDVGPWSGRSNHIMNGLFLLALAIQIVLRVYQLPHTSGVERAPCIFDIVLVMPTIMLIQSSFYISSYTTDVPTAVVLFIAVSHLFVQLVGSENYRDKHEEAYNLVVLTTMLTVAICFKLSAAAFSVVAWLLAVIWWLRKYQGQKLLIARTSLWVITLSLAFGLSWLGRGVILSGYPAYPSTFGTFSVEWRVPTEQAEAEQAWIGHFARTYYSDSAYNGLPYGDWVALQWKWLQPWVKSLIQEPEAQWQIYLPALLTILLLSAGLLLRHRGELQIEFASAGWLLLVPTLSGLAFWFFIAPRPVFGFFLFWICAALCAGQILSQFIGTAIHPYVAIPLVISLLIGTLPIVRPIAVKYLAQGTNPLGAFLEALFVKPGSDLWFHPTLPARLETFTTESGLHLYVPKDDNRCVNAPLPCTPHPAPNLRLRRPGSLKSGFAIDGAWQVLRWPNPKTAFLSSWRNYRSGIAKSRAIEH